ncbi:MAG: nuclear transport factor 2 family protein [Actinomycetota bacterium]|nr:nuclear transport factor 2 family protein [Actinomycetota bacterium]
MASANVELIQRMFEAFERRDDEALLAVMHPDLEFHVLTGTFVPRGEPYRGHAGLLAYLRQVDALWEELRAEPQEYRDVDPETVLALGRVYAWGAGRVIDAPAGWVWRLRDGLVVFGRTFASRDEALAFVGLQE